MLFAAFVSIASVGRAQTYGFNFRGTTGFVTDGSGESAVPGEVTELLPGAFSVTGGPSTTAALNPTSGSLGQSVTGTVAGTVTAAGSSLPLSGATVDAIQGNVTISSGTTGTSGQYSISGLPTGSYTVTVAANGYVGQSQSNVAVTAGTTTVNFALIGANPVLYGYDALGRLISVVDTTSAAATYTYDAVGNLLSIQRPTPGTVSIAGFTPASGPPGATVTLAGTGFSPTPSQNTLTFNGTAAAVTTSTPTQLVATVPTGATTGPLSVVTPTGSATSTGSFVIGEPGPTISNFSPTAGAAGTSVSITGSNFDLAGQNRVTFNGRWALVSATTATSLTVVVPPDASSGRISVTTPSGGVLSTSDFFVLPSANSTISASGRLTAGTPTPATITPANTIGLFLFDATAGLATVQLSGNTIGSVAVSLLGPDGSTLASTQTSSTTFVIQAWFLNSGTYSLLIQPAANSTGTNITINVLLTPSGGLPPPRPIGVLDPTNPLATNLAGLFVMNEGTGTLTTNLVDGQVASFAGTTPPTWDSADPSVVTAGGGLFASYLDAGADLAFDQLPTSQVTLVAKVYILGPAPISTPLNPSVFQAGIAEKNVGDAKSGGFVFGFDAAGALVLDFDKSTSAMQVATAGGALTPGRWLQLAYTWDGTVGTAAAAHLFINGVEQPKVTAVDGSGTLGSSSVTATYRPLRIGHASYGPSGSFNGKIAYFAVYKGRLLGSSDLTQLDSALPLVATNATVITPNSSSPTSVSPTGPTQPATLEFSTVTTQNTTIQLTNNTLGSVTVALVRADGSVVASVTSSASTFTLPPQSLTGTYRIVVTPAGTTTGSIGVAVLMTDLPSRPVGAVLDSTNPLATNLAGLFVMNEGSGTLTTNLVDGQVATFAGSTPPTWNTSDPSVVTAGGSSLASYLDAGADLAFDQLPISQVTVVAKVYLNRVTSGSIAEKDNTSNRSGFVFGNDSFGSGALRLVFEKSSSAMQVATAGGALTPGRWLQLAYTWDGTVGTAAAAHLFINGVEQPKLTAVDGSGLLGSSFATTTYTPLRIGNALNGKVAYVAIYKGRLLAPSDLTQLDGVLPLVATNATVITPNSSSPTSVSPTGPTQPATLDVSTVTTQSTTIQLSSNTLGSVTVALVRADGSVVTSVTSSASSFTLSPLSLTGTYRIVVTPAATTTGSIGVAVLMTDLPSRPVGAVLDSTNPLATNLAGLFVMNEGSGTLTTNLVDGQVATFAGSTPPTWNASDPSVVTAGGSSLASYLDAGADLAFDQLPISQVTVVAKVYVNTFDACCEVSLVEKIDWNTSSGFTFGSFNGRANLSLDFLKSASAMNVATAPGGIPTGRWVQLAYTWDGTVGTAAAAHLFINGVEQPKNSAFDGSGTLGSSGATNQSLTILGGGFGSLNGKVAYLAVYKGRILTATELAQLDGQLPIH